MALTPGTRIGSYEITAQIGVGGMGEVYRATDTNLGRHVAIKVLPETVASDADRLARFDREARTLAALNHPNIAALYGLEKGRGTTALVMELVEGPTLADRIAAGPMPVDEVLPIARQIAEALEAAHEQGIIHRDLKPANIKLRPDGTVKVLDFGLAKAIEPTGAASSSQTMSPTITTPAMTQAGLILGTAAYMSPEQAKGRPADRRSDVWAFGVVVYEMLTGRRAFDAEDVSETLAAVLMREPDWTALPPATPPAVATILRRCLQRERGQRVRDIGDVRLGLDGAFQSGAPADAHTGSGPHPRRRILTTALVAASVAAVLAGAIGAAVAWAFRPSLLLPVTRSRFVLPADQEFQVTNRRIVGISPDGGEIVFGAGADLLGVQLFLRPLAELEARPIPGTDSTRILNGMSEPVFAPDGRSIAYYDGAFKRIDRGGGTAVTLCEGAPPWGMSWYEDSILFGQGAAGIMRVPTGGGVPEQVVSVASGELAAGPQMLPGGRAVLFTLASAAATGADRWDGAEIVVQRLGSDERTTVVEGGSYASYLPTGHLVYAVGATLFAVPFDVDALERTGDAVPVLQGVLRDMDPTFAAGVAHYSVSANGTLAYVPGAVTASTDHQIVTVDPDGDVQPLPLPPGAYGSLRVSPDGRRLAFDTDDGDEASVWVYDLSGLRSPTRLTFDGRNRNPIWTADGERVLFQSDRDGEPAIYWKRADGSGPTERLTEPEPGTTHVPEAWSPVDAVFSYSVSDGSTVSLWTFSMADGVATRFGEMTSVARFNSEFSRDGKWMAYTLRTRTSANVFVEPFPATGARYQITTVNGHHPLWLPDGATLSYRIGSGQQEAVSIDTTAGFAFGNPVPAARVLLSTQEVTSNRSYDVLRDGLSFIMVSSSELATREIRIVQNWLTELEARVPTD